MDPLLKALSNDQLRGLVQEQRPEWATGQERVGGFQSVNSPEVASRRFAAPTPAEAELNLVKTALEEPTRPARRLWDALPGWLEKWGLQHKKAHLEEQRKPPEQRDQGGTGFDVVDLYGGEKVLPLLMGIMIGAKGAANLGGKDAIKYYLGKQALQRGDDPLEVFKKYKVSALKEPGQYGMELPLETSVEGALEQYRRVYGNQALKDIILGRMAEGGERAGFYAPRERMLYAVGRPDAPPTDPNSLRAVVEHELGHGASHNEGWSMGATPKNVERPREDVEYWRNADEVRSRALERRLDPKARELPPQFDEDVARELQIVSKYPGAVAAAVKEKGGMWHPEAVERLVTPLVKEIDKDLARNVNYSEALLRLGKDGEAELINVEANTKALYDQRAGFERMVRNYLNKHAGTTTDPLKDVEIPFGEGVERWEQLMDWSIGKANKEGLVPGTDVGLWSQFPGSEYMKPGEVVHSFDNFTGGAGRNSADAIKSYLSHVGDYLRQNVKPEKLQQYDLVRAVKETAANDARVAKEMEKAAQASMKDLPVYKDYSTQNPGTLQGMKWVELKKPEKLTPEQMKTVRPMTKEQMRQELDMGDELRGDEEGWMAVDPSGKPITNSYTGGLATAGTPEEAYLAGQLAQEGNQMGHCVGGYCEPVASGESRIFSLRDSKGKSHVTIETGPRGMPRFPEHYRPKGAPEEDIVQIKGKQNRAPNPEYLPYVQDFVKSGRWGEVGDLRNAGLMKDPDNPGGYIPLLPIKGER